MEYCCGAVRVHLNKSTINHFQSLRDKLINSSIIKRNKSILSSYLRNYNDFDISNNHVLIKQEEEKRNLLLVLLKNDC